MPSATSAWVGRIFLRPGRLVYVGAVGPTSTHAHHAFQVVLGVSGPIALADAGGESLETRAAVIPPDAVHAIATTTAVAAILYLDPDDHAGRRLRRTIAVATSPRGWSDAARPLAGLVPRLPESWDDVDGLEATVLDALAAPSVRPRPQHPAVQRALRFIGEDMNIDLSLPSIACAVGLSPSRLSHVFALDTGIPLRRYVLWRRLIRAANELGSGASLTHAAQAGGFTDSAHMNHAFRRMFGLAPSDVHRAVEWIIAQT